MGFLHAFAKIAKLIPTAPTPERRVDLREKMLWTGLALTVYLLMSVTPIYGIAITPAQDPFFFARIIFASKHGTLMELGIGPIVTAGLIMQLLVGSKMLKIDLSDPSDRAAFTGAQKALAVIITAVEAITFIAGGLYGGIANDLNLAALVFIQLFIAGLIVILLDEMVQKGWGLGSGVSLFIAAGVAQQIAWQSFSPFPFGRDQMALGAVLAFTQYLLSGKPFLDAFLRISEVEGKTLPLTPNMLGFISMIAVFIVIYYADILRVEIPVVYHRYRGLQAKIPLKFLYVSNIPVILASALFANIHFFARLLYNRDPNNFWVRLIAHYSEQNQPLPSLVYYITPPQGLADVLEDPWRALVYSLLLIALCVVFAITWVEASGMSARDQAKQLIDAGLSIPGFRSSQKIIERMLEKYISALTIISGFVVGVLAAVADVLGVIGTGIGILLTVSIINQYYELLLREQILEVYPSLRRIFE